MKRHHSLALLLSLAPLLAVSTACDPNVEAKNPTTPVAPAAPVAPVIQPTAERALQRSQERWAFGMKKEWVQAYDFSAPEVKRDMPLERYLGGMRVHQYENMRATDVLAIQGDKAFVRVSGLWTPKDPKISRVKLEPGQTLTQEITMIETWRFVDGDWCYVSPERDSDFFEKHPDLLKQPKDAAQPVDATAKQEPK